jgi:uncharacterized protein YndB with AHSA1/START domain
MSSRFSYVTQWRLDAPIAQVWDALVDVERWPQWWPHVREAWTLSLHTRWMRLVAPLMAPVFRWNHEGVMHSGGQGLARWLAQRPALRSIAS